MVTSESFSFNLQQLFFIIIIIHNEFYVASINFKALADDYF